MARALTAGLLAALQSSNLSPIVLLEAVFSTLTLRLWNGSGDLSWSGVVWSGNGWFRGWEGGTESDEISETSIDVSLSGLPAEMVSLILTGSKHGATGKLYLGALDSSSQLIADPYLLFQGELDTPELDEGVADAEISLRYSTAFSNNDRAKEYRYDPETQRIFYPDDRGFEYITSTLEWDGSWGIKKKKPKAGNSTKAKNTKRK